MFFLKDAVWILGLNDDYRSTAVRQLTDILGYMPRLSDAYDGKFSIVVEVKEFQKGEDSHRISTEDTSDGRCIRISGNTQNGALYGVFSFLEETGYYFLASETIRPEEPAVEVPVINKAFTTSNSWRGMFVSFCMVSTSIMSLDDFKNLFDSMLRMKMNRIVFYPFENEPLIDYSYRGERKVVGDISRPESGYFSYGRHWTGSFRTDEIAIGRECFGDRKRVAPMEFQDVDSSDEALDTAKKFFRDIINEAAKRKIGVWLSFLPQFVPMNMAKFIRPMARRNLHWSALVSCTDPVVKEINEARIKNIIESYPDLEGVFVGIPEGFYDDPYEDSSKYIASQMPDYKEALELQGKYWGDHWPGEELQKKHMEADIAFSKIALDAVGELGKYGVRRGLITVCKAYLLTKLHKILPEDVAFCDIESRSLWTHDGAPLFLFKNMSGRECSIIPRITDDGSQAGMQFNLNLYHKDGYCRSTRENGTCGLMMQTLFINGADHNIKYLAEGLWNADITPQSFYEEFLGRIFKTAAEDINKAYDILEENEEFMGGRGAANMPWNHVPPEIAVLRSLMESDNPFHECPVSNDFIQNSVVRAEIYKTTIRSLEKAAGIFRRNIGSCQGRGQEICSYMMNRTEAYKTHLEAMVMLSKIYEGYMNVFDSLNVAKNLRALAEECRKASDKAVRSAELFADCVEHTTDLSPLWMMNSSMVRGTGVLAQFMENILAYHEGREYWKPVAWDTLFGTCPYPAHKITLKNNPPIYEPG